MKAGLSCQVEMAVYVCSKSCTISLVLIYLRIGTYLGVGRIRVISCIWIINKFYERQILPEAIAVDF